MSKKITELTPEQKAQLPGWGEQWIAKGHCTDEADWDRFEAAAEKCYGFAGIPWPGRVVRVGSPIVGRVVSAMLSVLLPEAPGGSREKLEGVVKEVAEGFLGRSALADSASLAVLSSVEGGAGVRSRKATVSRLEKAVRSEASYFGGSMRALWPAFTSFLRDVCKLELDGDLWDRDRAYAEAQMSAGWWWPYRDFVVVTDRPSVLHVDQFRPGQWRLHCETGPAVAYRDGWKLYFLEGLAVKPHVVETPDKITIEEIHNEKNPEVRRVIQQQYGLLRYFKTINAQPLDSRFGEALFRDPPLGRSWLVCTDGSTGRVYQLSVPGHCETVAAAQYALNGVDSSLMLARS